MAITTKSGTPNQFRAGDTTSFTNEFSDYPSSSWTLTHYFLREGEETISVEATDGGSDTFLTTLTPTISGRFKAGDWQCLARVFSQSGGVDTVIDKIVNVLADPAAEREKTHAEKMLAAVRAVQLKRAGKAYNSSDLGGQSFSYKTDAELHELEKTYLARVKVERSQRKANEDGRPRRMGLIRLNGGQAVRSVNYWPKN